MPPSRGLRPIGQLLGGIRRTPGGGVRALSSTSLAVARTGLRTRPVAPVNSRLPATSYVLNSGRASLSLWPFSGGAAKAADTPAPGESQVAAAQAPQPPAQAAPSSPAEAVSSTAATPSPTTPPATGTDASSIDAQLASILQDTPADAASAPPLLLDNITQIGQMKEIGLNFGWGPTSVVEWVVEHIHVYAGTPWFATIILSAVAMRVAMIYPFFRMSDNQAKMAVVNPQMKLHISAAQKAQAEGDRMAQQIAQKQMQILRARNGISLSWMFAPLIVQGVFGFGAFKLTRAMAALPVPGFETGGFGWLMDLSVSDPTYMLPVAMGIGMHILARTTEASPGTDPAMARMAKPLGLYIFPALMFLVTFWQCAALQLSFLTATIFGVLQNKIFRNKSFRDRLGMTQFPEGPSAGSQDPFAGMVPSSVSSSAQPAVKSNSPFANLNLARSPKGSAFETGVRYQAPTAASTLNAYPTSPQSQTTDQSTPEVPKNENFLSRELKTAKQNLGSFMEGAKEKARDFQQKGGQKSVKGRNQGYVNEAKRYEARRREREESEM